MELSRVNFILGPNNAGKTSFFQAYELASWVQKHGSVNGLRQADVRNVLLVRPGSMNSDYPLEKALDFTVSARSKSGDFIQEASFIGDEHRVKMWGFEIDGFTLRLWPDAEGQLKWVAHPVGQRSEPWPELFRLKNLKETIAKEVSSAFAAFGFEMEAAAEVMLSSISGKGEAVALDEVKKMPTALIGRLAWKGEHQLILDGSGEFWLADHLGRKLQEANWEKVLGVNLTALSKLDCARLFWLHRSLLRYWMMNRLVSSGSFSLVKGLSLSEVLVKVGDEWSEDATKNGHQSHFQLSKGGWDFITALDDLWWGQLEILNWFDEVLPHQMEQLGLGKEIRSFPRHHEITLDDKGELDIERFWQGVPKQAVFSSEELQSGLLVALLRQGLDQEAAREIYKSRRTWWDFTWNQDVWKGFIYSTGEKGVFSVDWIDGAGLDWDNARWRGSDYLRELFLEEMRSVARDDKEYRSRFGKPEWVKGIPAKDWKVHGISRKDWMTKKSLDWHLNVIRKIASMGGVGKLYDYDNFKDDGSALASYWSRISKNIRVPLSFELIRVSPEAEAIQAQYHRPSDFPFPEMWESLESSSGSPGRRRRLKNGSRVIATCLKYLGVADGFDVVWRSARNRVDVLLPSSVAGDSAESLSQLWDSPGRGREVVAGSRKVGKEVSHWYTLEKEFDEEQVEREMVRDDIGRVENLGRGSRLVLNALMSMYEASLREQPCIVILEEPSAFLHPMMAAKFSEVLRFAAEKFDVQVVVETHNEYMVRQLVTKRLEGSELEDVTIHYFPQENEADLLRLSIDEEGRIDPPIPDGFLDKSAEIRREQRLLRRKMEEE